MIAGLLPWMLFSTIVTYSHADAVSPNSSPELDTMAKYFQKALELASESPPICEFEPDVEYARKYSSIHEAAGEQLTLPRSMQLRFRETESRPAIRSSTRKRP